MFGTIHYCLEKTIIKNYGKENWENCLVNAGYKREHTFGADILKNLDEGSLSIFPVISQTLDVDIKTIFDQFGEYWCCTYAPEIYPYFYEQHKSTKEFIVGLDDLHKKVTSKKPNSKPPAFRYEWNGDVLKVTYMSDRDLFELFESLLRGMDKYFGTETEIERQGKNQLNLSFQENDINSSKFSA